MRETPYADGFHRRWGQGVGCWPCLGTAWCRNFPMSGDLQVLDPCRKNFKTRVQVKERTKQVLFREKGRGQCVGATMKEMKTMHLSGRGPSQNELCAWLVLGDFMCFQGGGLSQASWRQVLTLPSGWEVGLVPNMVVPEVSWRLSFVPLSLPWTRGAHFH